MIQKQELKTLVLDKIDLSKELKDDEIFEVIDEILLIKSKDTYMSMRDKNRLRWEVFNAIRRLDILQELIEDDSITEIMINGPNHIFIEKKGGIYHWDKQFESGKKLEDIVQQIVSKSNRIINESNPIVDARLDDGSRVNIVLPPISLNGPVITIRKFPGNPITIENLIAMNSITNEGAQFLKKLVISGYNIFISGGTGSGKTTFLNVLSNYIPGDERVITIEDSAELQINKIPNLVRLEARNSNIEGNNEVTIRQLIKSALRMRPDRIIIGEVRDGAALDMLQAMNSGHDGSLSTGHANSTVDMLSRLETLVLMAMDLPLIAVRKQITSAIDVIVHLERLRDKTRKVTEIAEVLELEGEHFALNKLFEFIEEKEENGKVIGKLTKTGNQLRDTGKLSKAGIMW